MPLEVGCTPKLIYYISENHITGQRCRNVRGGVPDPRLGLFTGLGTRNKLCVALPPSASVAPAGGVELISVKDFVEENCYVSVKYYYICDSLNLVSCL